VDAGEWSAFSSGSVTLGGDAGLPDGPHTLHVKVKDEAGNEDASPVERSFTVDATVPTVECVDPVSGARGAPRGTDVEVTFSEGMDPCSIDHPRFELYKRNKDRQRWQWVINTGLSTWLPDVGCDIPPPTTATLDPYPSDPSTLLVKDTKYRVVMAVQPPGEGGGGGAHVYDEGAGPGPLQQAALPGDHLLDLGRPGQHGDDNVALLGDLPGRVGDLGPGRGKVRAPDDTSGAAERLLRPLGPGRKPPAHAGPPGRSCAPRRGAGEGDPGGMHDIEDRPAMAGTRTTSMSMGYLAEGYLLSSSQRSKSETLTRRNLPAL
jgi:hypothetical protein